MVRKDTQGDQTWFIFQNGNQNKHIWKTIIISKNLDFIDNSNIKGMLSLKHFHISVLYRCRYL